jgi:hypothetical protein
MPIVESEEFISLIVYIVKNNCLQNSNFSFQFKSERSHVDCLGGASSSGGGGGGGGDGGL